VEEKMPLFVRQFLMMLLVITTFLCILVPFVIGLWQIYVSPARHVPAKPVSKELLGAIFGILFVDFLSYVRYRPDLPRHFFYAVMVGLNGLCLLFVCYSFVAWWLYQKATRHEPPSSPQILPPLENEVRTSV
jgi:hypothetical protein